MSGVRKIIPGLVQNTTERPHRIRWEYDEHGRPSKATSDYHYALVKWEDEYYESWSYACYRKRDDSTAEKEGSSSGYAWLKKCVKESLRRLDGADMDVWLPGHHNSNDLRIRHRIDGAGELEWFTYWTANPGCFSHSTKTKDGININVGYITYQPDVPWVQCFGKGQHTKAARHYIMRDHKDFVQAVKEVMDLHRELVFLREQGRDDVADHLYLRLEREDYEIKHDLLRQVRGKLPAQNMLE